MKAGIVFVMALAVAGCYSILGHPSVGTTHTIGKNGVPCFALADPGWRDWRVGFIQVIEEAQPPEVVWEVGIDAPYPVINKKDCVAWGQTFDNSEVRVPMPQGERLKTGQVYGISMMTSPVGDDRDGRGYSGYFCLTESPAGGWEVQDLGLKKDACPVAQ
ncbi:hypothetical protein ACRYJU_04945 [Alloalcanivorax xenomutans]|uniref:Lipoprotein n=1 Tax=Alloalcanivorax balearicus MACL04 TaxID=1177182 RepID=A0ABT2R2L8_9GAMM|nr:MULTISPECIES: hypothetical protein [Alloalcanivorax]MCU5784016.1 hypothetical protein [Alloalcanivorax balearicus MACL04]WOA33527.1 hypothetical protein RVY87_10675 [Alloalcanivorax xenomutans]